MPPHPVFSEQEALLELQGPGVGPAQLQTEVPARHCTHTRRGPCWPTPSPPHAPDTSPSSQPAPSPLSSHLSRQGVTSSTAAMPAPTFAAWPTRHRLLAEQIQGDKPWKPLLHQCYLHNDNKQWPTNNGPVEGLPASANVSGIVGFVSFRKLPVEHWLSCLTQLLDCSSPQPAKHPRHHWLCTKTFNEALDCQLNESESKFAYACRQHPRRCTSSWSTDN